MKEVIAEVMTAGALLMSPHPTEHPAVAEPAAHTEISVDTEAATAAQFAQPEVASAQIQANDTLIEAGALEVFDPNTVTFWFEVGMGSMVLTGISGFVTSRRLKGSLRRNHANTQKEGW